MAIYRNHRASYLIYEAETGKIVMRGRTAPELVASEAEMYYPQHPFIEVADVKMPSGKWQINLEKLATAQASPHPVTWDDICERIEQ